MVIEAPTSRAVVIYHGVHWKGLFIEKIGFIRFRERSEQELNLLALSPYRLKIPNNLRIPHFFTTFVR